MPPELRDTIDKVVDHFDQDDPGEFDPGSLNTAAPADPPVTDATPPASPTPASSLHSETTPATSVASTAPNASVAPPVTPGAQPQDPAVSSGQQLAAQKYPTAPGTWKPEAREHWTTIPESVREEIHRREKDATRALNDSTAARKFSNEFERTVQPYLGFIAAENSTPLQAVNNLMQTAALLRVGTSQQKVSLVADLITRYGVDLVALDNVLGGQQQAPDMQSQLREMLAQEMAPFRQLMQQQTQRTQFAEQQLDEQIDQELEAFRNEVDANGQLKHEFYNDVSQEMADIIELAARRGVTLSLTDAYQRAILHSEPVRRVIEQRQQRQAAQESQRIATTARRNAVSIPSSAEAGIATPKPGDSLRSAIEFAMSNTQGS